MKRYLLFAGDQYYPRGGWADFKGSYDTELEAVKAATPFGGSLTWCQVVDGTTGTMIHSFEAGN